MSVSYTSSPPVCLHGVVLSKSTGTTLPLPLSRCSKIGLLAYVINV